MLITLLVSAAVNLLIGTGVLSQPFASLGLLIAAVGVFTVQMRRRKRAQTAAKPPQGSEAAPAGEVQTGGKILTAVWFAVLLGWVATLVYALFVR